jgi:hypothetical protein
MRQSALIVLAAVALAVPILYGVYLLYLHWDDPDWWRLPGRRP